MSLWLHVHRPCVTCSSAFSLPAKAEAVQPSACLFPYLCRGVWSQNQQWDSGWIEGYLSLMVSTCLKQHQMQAVPSSVKKHWALPAQWNEEKKWSERNPSEIQFGYIPPSSCSISLHSGHVNTMAKNGMNSLSLITSCQPSEMGSKLCLLKPPCRWSKWVDVSPEGAEEVCVQGVSVGQLIHNN